MSTVNIFRSEFTAVCETLRFDEEKPLRELLPGLDWEMSLVFVNGFQKDEDYVLRAGDVCTVRCFAGGFWGTRFGGWLSSFRVGKAFKSFTQSISISKFIHACMHPINTFNYWKGRAQNWLMGGAKENPWEQYFNNQGGGGNSSDGSSSQSLTDIPTIQGARNGNGYDKPIPLAFGRALLTPYYCGNMYRTISGTDGEKQTAHCLFMLGYNDIQVTDIKLGNIELASNSAHVDNGSIAVDGRWDASSYGIKLELRQGASEVGLYPQKVTEEQLGIELTHINDSSAVYGLNILELNRLSAKNPMTVELEFTVQGLIGYNSSNGNKENRSVQICIDVSFDGGNSYQTFAMPGGFTSASVGKSIMVANHWVLNPVVYTLTRQKSKVMRFVARRTFSYAEAMSMKNRYAEFRIFRYNAASTDSNTSDTILLSAVRTWCYDYTASKAAGYLVPQVPVIAKKRDITARLGLEMQADQTEFSGQIDALNCIITAKGRTWNAVTRSWSTAVTANQNPASMMLRAMQHKMRGAYAYKDSEIDMDALGTLWEWCNQPMASGSSKAKFVCNLMLTGQKKTSDVLETILSTCRAQVIVNEDKYGVWIDKPEDTPVMVLNNQNLLSASNTKEFKEPPDGFKIKFIDENDGFQTNEITVCADGVDKDSPDIRLEQMEVSAMTDAERIYQYGRYELAKTRLRPEVWSRKVSLDGNLLEIGSLVAMQDDTISVGIGDGAEILEVVTEGWYITAIETDGKMYVDDLSAEYGVTITQTSDRYAPKVVTKKVVIAEAGEQHRFVFAEPISLNEQVTPCVGDIVSFGFFSRITTDALVFGKKDNGDGTFQLTLVPYQPGIYTADSGEIPEFDSKVSTMPEHNAGNYQLKPASVEGVMESVKNITQGTDTSYPDDIITASAVAQEDGISLRVVTSASGLNNSISLVTWTIDRGDGSAAETVVSSSRETKYLFRRAVDGYPEKDDLDGWEISVYVTNLYRLTSKTEVLNVNTDRYGTWKLSAPAIYVRISDRTVTLKLSQPPRADGREEYGAIKYRVQVRRPDIDTDWHKPATSLNPYGAETNYKDGKGYVLSDGTYIQTMPLRGQATDDSVDTAYQFRVQAENEAGEGGYSEANATALCTSIRDFVKANETQKKAYISQLSALSANIGSIFQGAFGRNFNLWDLSTFIDDYGSRHYEGHFRVGSEDQYIEAVPLLDDNGEPTGKFDIVIHAGVFEISATASKVNGELVMQESEESLYRIRLSPKGIYFDTRDAPDSDEWKPYIKQDATGVTSPSLLSEGSLVISNADIAERRKLGHDIGKPYLSEHSRVYHFDTDALDQNGESDLSIVGNSALMDGAPMLNVAPYSEVSRALYSDAVLAHALGGGQEWTLDFWRQGADAGELEMVEAGSTGDRISVWATEGEPEYNNDGAYCTDEAQAYNVPLGAGQYAAHRGIARSVTVSLPSAGISLGTGWEHVAVVQGSAEISLFAGESSLEFPRYDTFAHEASALLNGSGADCAHDELFIDPSCAEGFALFSGTTGSRIPWAALDREQKWLIFDTFSTDMVRSNVFDMVHPVGSVYVQFPQQASPMELWGTWSTWEILDYNGAFFRSEGKNADKFIPKTGVLSAQEEGLPNITGGMDSYYVRSNNSNQIGALYYGKWSSEKTVAPDNGATRVGLYFNASRSNAIYGASAHVTPVNYTVRVWRRVA